MKLHFDFETRSVVDLITAGQYAYAEHPSTQAILASWAVDDEPFKCWYILNGEPIPFELRLAFLDPTVTLVAHNASFERIISVIVGPRQGFFTPDIVEAIKKPERWSCTAARAAAVGLPRALEKVAMALYLKHQKDMEGHRLMLEMCKPHMIALDGTITWLEDTARIKRLGQYCISDGYAEREVDSELPELSPFEHETWCTTEKMNDRGIEVDETLVQRLMFLTKDATNYLNGKLHALSQLSITGSWCGIGSDNRECYQRDGDAALNEHGMCTHCGGRPLALHDTNLIPKVTNPKSIVRWLADYGIDTEDSKIGKWIIAGLLEDEDIPPIVREVLILRRDGGKSSTSKFNTLMKRMNLDVRIRGALMYAGAAATKRWSSKGVQLQNLPRGGKIKKIADAISAVIGQMTIRDIEKNFGPPMVVASELLRPVFIAGEGCWLARADYSQIEARVNAWLAGEIKVLRAFAAYDRGEGPDIYIVTASGIYGVAPGEITKDDPRRQVGKVTILACGFQGGLNAFKSMARIYNVKISDEKAEEAKTNYRLDNPNIVSFWYDLNAAAVSCMQGQPGELHHVRTGIYFKRNDTVLTMHLPSGSNLVYWYPRLEMKPMPWDANDLRPAVTYYAEDSQKKVWRRFTAYGGLFCENCLAGDTEILTNAGWKHLDTITQDDQVWDGCEWVKHDGLIRQGIRKTMDFGGVRLTPDHKVYLGISKVAADRTTPEEATWAFSQCYKFPVEYSDYRPIRYKGSGPTAVPVYDLLNAGPRHRFTVRTKDGRPFVVSNCVQAVARDIMAFALNNLERLGARPVLTVHDEAVCQLSKTKFPTREAAKAAMLQVVTIHPDWLPDWFPLVADASADDRYVKA